MEIGRIPADVINAFVTEIPIGSQGLDTEIIIHACQNRAADLCSVYATKASDITLAFEMVACHGLELQLRSAVIDRCAQSLGSANLDLAAAALKCLLSLHEFKRVNFQRLSLFVASTHRALLAVEAMAAERYAGSAGCGSRVRDAGLAAHLLQLFEAEQYEVNETALRALACAARHAELHPRIARMLKDGPFSVAASKLTPAVARLLARLSRTK
jgi:hypothetical protein